MFTPEEQSLNAQLLAAAWNGDAEVCRDLLTANANPEYVSEQCNYAAIHLAAMAGHADVIKVFFEFGGIDLLKQKTPGKLTPAFIACKEGHPGIIYMLQECGFSNADFDEIVSPRFHLTIAHIAAQKGHQDVVQALEEVGADLSIKDIHGHTPKDFLNKPFDLIKGLEDAGVVRVIKEKDLSPSHRAAMDMGFI